MFLSTLIRAAVGRRASHHAAGRQDVTAPASERDEGLVVSLSLTDIAGVIGPGERIVSFAIHDSGAGIAEENLDRVFVSFFTTKAEGMGLAICQSIITAHGGTIGVSNHPSGGALFRFALPAAETAGR